MDIVYFILLVGVLIFIHELGHFAWAKFFGVKVLTFSLGFGKKLLGFKVGDTEYVLGALPLGGYVRMLGENPNDVVSEADEERAFYSQPLWRRIVIVVAGPAMNLLFPIVIYFVVFLSHTTLRPAEVGAVFPDRPADGQLVPGDRILSVDGDEVTTFDEVIDIVGGHPDQPLQFRIDREGEIIERTITPVLTQQVRELDLVDEVGRIGIAPDHPTAVIGVTSPSSPAGAARLRTFDRIVSASGRPIDRFLDLERAVGPNGGAMVPITYLRPTRVDGALGGLATFEVYDPHVATLTPEPGEGSGLERAGIEPADLYVSHVTAGSPEHRVGILPGDRLVSLDGRPIRLWATFLEDLRILRGAEHTVTLRRGDRTIEQHFRLRHERGVNEHGQPYDRYVVGIRNWVPLMHGTPAPNPHLVRYAVREAFASTLEMMELTTFSVVRLVQGRLTVKSIGGPLAILEVAGTAAREGTLNYLSLMAFVSINLGLINLLPIPMLDGGHLLFFTLEGISRRKLSVRARQIASLAGFAMLVVLMVLALKNDLERQWPHIADALASDR